MAPSLIKHSLMVLALMYIFIVPGIIGNTDEYTPQIGAEGSGLGNLPQTGGVGQYIPPQTGVTGTDDPAEVVSKALLCFNDNYVYSSCEQAYRLTASGNIDVPPEYTDQYCNGACLTETNLVLNCIDSVLSHFLFYNRASILDVRTTIKSGCSYGPKRGNFNVAEHLQTGENSAHKGSRSFLFGFFLVFVYMGYNILF